MKTAAVIYFALLGLVACGGAEEKIISNPISSVVEKELPVENDTLIIGGVDGIEENAYLFDGKRDELTIELIGKDSIVLRGKLISKEELKKEIRYFYTANLNTESDDEMPRYYDVSASALEPKIASLSLMTQGVSSDSKLLAELKILELKQKICGLFPTNSFREISSSATIKIEVHPNTKNGRYDEMRDIIYDAIIELREEKRKTLNWKSNQTEKEMKTILEFLIPERVLSINSEA